MSCAPFDPSIATEMVRARSAAEMRFDRHGEGGFVPGSVITAHQTKAQIFDPLLRQRQADEAAAMGRHEVDGVGRRHLRGDDKIALIFPVFVVDQDEHAAVAGLVDDFFGRCKRRPAFPAQQIAFKLAQRFGRGVPIRVPHLAQRVGVQTGSTGEAGPGHAAFMNEGAQGIDEGG
jgi:hypothetical protein